MSVLPVTGKLVGEHLLLVEDPDAEQALLAEEDGPVIEATADEPSD